MNSVLEFPEDFRVYSLPSVDCVAMGNTPDLLRWLLSDLSACNKS